MRLPRSRAPRLLLAALALAACSDGVSAPDALAPPPEAQPVAALACRADVRGGSVGCDGATRGGGARLTLIGGQGVSVKLTSSEVRYDAATSTFSAQITVQNLTAEAMGPESGAEGVRVFFHSGPVVTAGVGAVEVANAAGWGTFTGGAQPYFEYAGTLQPGEVSPPLRWEWTLPASVESFAFSLFVAAGMQPAAPSSTLAFRSLSAAGQNACGVTLGGRTYCWGHTAFGQIGAGAAIIPQGVTYRPVAVTDGAFDTVSVAEYGACALRGGETWCWGSDLDGGLGTGGVSSGCNGTAGSNAGCVTTPVRSAAGLAFRRIAAGGAMQRGFGPPYGRFNCGIDAAGTASCWGSDGGAQLGDGAQYPLANPSPVPVAGGITFASISAGNDHSCGVDTQGRAYCWGTERVGELGNDTAIASTTAQPSPVRGGLAFRQVDAGHSHSCGVTTAGEAWCWGSNYNGQLGTASPVEECSTDPMWPYPCSRAPVRVDGGHRFTQVTVGQRHSCGVTTTGEVWCWGRAYEVGRGSTGIPGEVNCTPNDQTPCVRQPVRIGTSERFVQVEAGREFTCALAENRRVWCWGTDQHGTAQGNGIPIYTPRPIVGPSS